MTTTLVPRGPEDLLAVVPIVLGFHPEESVVMLTFGAASSFHARLDLPPPEEEDAVTLVVDSLLGPCRRHEVQHVAFVVYSADAAQAARLAAGLLPAFAADGIEVIHVLRSHDDRWCTVPPRAGADESPMLPYDASHHPFAARAVFEGRVTRRSREDLRATLAPDFERRARWASLLEGLPPAGPADALRVGDLVSGWLATGEDPDDDGAARVLGAVTRPDVRDAALYAVTRETARDHVRVWSALLRGAPDPQVPDTAAVTAFCAWQSGDGALAWCALDRCFEVDPEHRLGTCLGECLARAVPPSVWDEVGSGDEPRSDSA